jgi:hypothetical protein
VHEPRAIDPSLGQPAPFVRRAQVRAGLRDRIAVDRLGGVVGTGTDFGACP